MSEKQHFVPVTYLKHFTKEDLFYTTKPKSEYYSKPVQKHPNQVCYRTDFYNSNKLEIIPSEDYIERNAFKYEREELNKIFGKLINKAPFLYTIEYKKLLEIYLSLKHRNLAMWNFYKDFDFSTHIDNSINKLNLIEKFSKIVTQEPVTVIIERVKNSLLNDKVLSEQVYKESLFKQAFGKNETINDSYRVLSQLKAFVLEPINKDDYFITSDNPGYSIVNERQVFNMNLGNFDFICFPINSKRLLTFYSIDNFHPLDLKKKIHHLRIPTENVTEFNDGTSFNCIQNIFCENLEYLDRYTNRFRLKHKEYLKIK